LLIVNPPPTNTVNPTIREWLRSERRLGIRHVGLRAAIAPPAESARPAEGAAVAGTAGSGPPQNFSLLSGLDEGLPALCDRALSKDQAQQALDLLNENYVRGCTRCELHAAGRKQTVFGVGDARAEIMFVGEGPGAEEDRQGIPFVGRAGQLLTRMIAAMTLTRDQVYIANVVKCRPPGNRTPMPPEMETCSPYLFRQLAIIRPKVIVALGRPAAQALLATSAPIGRLRGQFHDFPPPALAHLGLPPARLMPTFHPAYLLRSPNEKAKAWEDLKQVMRHLGLAIPPR
jgi:uracil-DNA glycosylase family 4